MRSLWRLTAWGGAASIALAAVVLVTHTQIGGERLQLALANMQPSERLIVDSNPPRNRDVEIRRLAQDVETRRLADAVRTLTADRDRLVTRVATLERNLEDMTGSIKAQQAQVAKESTTKDVTKEALAASTSMASAPATIAARIEPTQSTSQQPEAAAQIPLPPLRTASAAASTAETTTASIAPAKPEIGIELGSASSIEALRAQWAAIKANHGPALTGLQPSAVTRTNRTGATTYRLVAGPFPNGAAATQFCARLAPAQIACRPGTFSGQKLTQQ